MNGTERYSYILGVTKEGQSDRRSTLRKKGLSTMYMFHVSLSFNHPERIVNHII